MKIKAFKKASNTSLVSGSGSMDWKADTFNGFVIGILDFCLVLGGLW